MSMQFLELGKATFVSSKANLLVEITASAGLLCESDRHLDVRPGESWGCLAICEDIWICKSHDFHLSFVTSSDCDTTGSTGIEDIHLEDIENKLETTQLWKQLGLEPSLLQQVSSTGRPFESSRRQFVLALRDDHGEQVQDQSNGVDLPCLSSDVANLRAPESVNTIQLVSVPISLRFKAAQIRYGEEFSTTKSLGPLAATASLFNGKNHLQDDQHTIEECPQDFESLLENDDFGPWSTLMDIDCHSEATAKQQKSKGAMSSKAIIPLADIAIRSLICPRPMRSPAAILSCEENSLFNLANLAPAVFIPGYRDAVLSRAKLIPTIAKSLFQFLQHSENKAPFAPNAKGTKASAIEPSADEDTAEQKGNIKQHLWMTLTNGVKNVESARKLKPLHIACTGGAQQSPCRTFEDLLDTWCPYKGDTMSPLEDDFEDLIEEQDFADCEDEYFIDLYEEVLSTSEIGIVKVTNVTTAHFDDQFSEASRNSQSPHRTLDATLELDFSTSWPKRLISCEHEAAAATYSGSRASRDLRARLDSSDTRLNEATQSCISISQPDVIGRNEPSHAYVSRQHPSYTFEDSSSSSSRAEPLLLEQFDLHAFEADPSISPDYELSTPPETQDIIAIDEAQSRKLRDNSDPDTEMPSYEKSNRSSLTDIIGGDQLLWQMWTKRRPSMIQTDDDMLEMHTMYAQDPDMRLLETHKELDDNGDEYKLDSESSNASSINSASSTNRKQDVMFPYDLNPRVERKHHYPFHLHKDSSPASSQSDTSRPTSRRRLSLGQSFIKRISGARTSVEETSSPSRPFSHDGPRDVEIKRRKTLADYDKSSDSDDMLLR